MLECLQRASLDQPAQQNRKQKGVKRKDQREARDREQFLRSWFLAEGADEPESEGGEEVVVEAEKAMGGKPVIVTGDLNVAHRDIDIYNYFAPHVKKTPGCTEVILYHRFYRPTHTHNQAHNRTIIFFFHNNHPIATPSPTL